MRSILSAVLSPIRSGGKAALLPSNTAPLLNQTLEVTGEVLTPLRLSVADLQAMPGHDWVALTSKTCAGTAQKAQKKGYRGVLLREIILQAALKSDDPKGWKRAYIVAHASDGYVALFSWNELLNTEIGDAVLVVYAQHSEALGTAAEQISLVSGGDRHSGARHVKWLKSIELRTISG